MLSKYIPKHFAQAMIKHVVAVSLFFPYVYSARENLYYQDFILANFFAVLAMIFIFTSWKLDLRKNGILLAGMGILLIAYNVCFTYMNYHYHHWYGEQINTTIIFLFFMVLLMVKDVHALIDNNVIRSIIHMMVITNVLAIGYRLITNQNRILIMNNYVRLDKFTDEVSAPQYSWLYIHKSQYALILVLCIAFCVVYRKLFRNVFTYLLSLGVLIFALYLSDTYTSMAAATLIFIGQFLDYLWKAKWWKKLISFLGFGIPGILFCLKLLNTINKNRNILTLGSRNSIWKASIELISNNANGMINFNFGVDTFYCARIPSGWPFDSYNCHNVFLNQMFRFSIIVGGLFTLLFLTIFLFSFKRNFSFTTIFIEISLFIPLCMDNAMTNIELSLFIPSLFILFFNNPNNINKKPVMLNKSTSNRDDG